MSASKNKAKAGFVLATVVTDWLPVDCATIPKPQEISSLIIWFTWANFAGGKGIRVFIREVHIVDLVIHFQVHTSWTKSTYTSCNDNSG